MRTPRIALLASVALLATAATAHVDAELSSTVGYSYSYLYECDNGNPSVATAYANGSWGSIDGDWYVIAGNIPNSSTASGSCCWTPSVGHSPNPRSPRFSPA